MRNYPLPRNGKRDVPNPLPRGAIAPEIVVIQPESSDETAFTYPSDSYTLILFLRGTWCIYCKEQLRALQSNISELEINRFRIACISGESLGVLATFKRKSGLTVPLFSDPSHKAAKAFGVHYWLRYDGFNLAHPALFIMSPSGEILVSYVSKSMADLPVGHLLDKFLSFLAQPPQESSDAN